MRITRSTVVTAIAVLILAAAVPSALLDTLETGRIYLFSREFLEDLPRRLTGPGRFRFLVQPIVAMVLGIRGGVGDARAGRRPYLVGLFFHSGHRKEYLRDGLAAVRDIVAVSIILDVVVQALVYRLVHPGAALVVGPVLIGLPYVAARGLANRVAGRRTGTSAHPPPSPSPTSSGFRSSAASRRRAGQPPPGRP